MEKIYVTFGENVRRLRREREMTQAQLAKVAFISRATIANIEAGRQSVTLSQAQSLSRCLEVPMPELLSEEPIPLRAKQELAERGVSGSDLDVLAKMLGGLQR